MTNRHKFVCILLIIVLVAMFLAFAAARSFIKETDRLHNEKIQALAAPYKLEQVKYSTELQNLERELFEMLPCGSTMTLVVTSPKEMLYTTMYPIFKGTSDYNVKNEDISLRGTVCLSDTNLPGGEGNITLEQLKEMMADGWTTALYVDHVNASNLAQYLVKMAAELYALGLSMPDTAYFISGAYNIGFDGLLLSHGIRNVVHHEEGGLETIGTDLESAMWRAGDVGWNDVSSANSTFTALISTAGSLSFSVSFDEWDKSRRFVGDDMGNGAFSRMLDKFRECIRSNSMYVGPLSEGKEAYKVHNDEYLRLSPQLEPRRQALQAKIDEINAILFRIYSGDFSVIEEEK